MENFIFWWIYGTVFGIVFGLAYRRFIKKKKTGEIEQDERTEKIAGKAARMTVLSVMGVTAVVLYLEVFEIYKFGTPMALSLVLTSLLVSMIGFRRYYNRKGEGM